MVKGRRRLANCPHLRDSKLPSLFPHRYYLDIVDDE
ncbi:hypothetical protein Gpo141_00012252, partial [Globisporangium polare]